MTYNSFIFYENKSPNLFLARFPYLVQTSSYEVKFVKLKGMPGMCSSTVMIANTHHACKEADVSISS